MENLVQGDEPYAQIAELNLLFLRLVEALAVAGDGEIEAVLGGLEPSQARRLLTLDELARAELAGAPVALFRLPLDGQLPGDRLDPLPWIAPGTAFVRHAFALTALAGAWHAVRLHPAWAAPGFGLSLREVALLRDTPVAGLPALAGAAATGLRVRFVDGQRFWPTALDLAARCCVDDLRLLGAAAFHMASGERMADGVAWACSPESARLPGESDRWLWRC